MRRLLMMIVLALSTGLTAAYAESYKVGIDPHFAPYEFNDEHGQMIGFDIDLIRAIAKDRGFEVQLFNDPWVGLIESLSSGKRDIVISAITITPERLEKYDASKPYGKNIMSAGYTNPDLNISDMRSLTPLRVGALKNTQDVDLLREIGVSNLKEYETIFLGIKALAQNKIDTFVTHNTILSYFIKQHPSVKINIHELKEEENNIKEIAIFVKKGNKDLLQKINMGLDSLENSGELNEIRKKWVE